MGCNGGCGGGNRGQSIGAVNAQLRAASSLSKGSTLEDPLVIGESDDRVLRVRVSIAVENLRIGNAYFVTGSGVQQHLDSGAFVDVTGIDQKARLFKVGKFEYSDPQEARRVGAKFGLPVIEVA